MLTLRPIRLNFSSPAQSAWAESIEGRYSYCRGEPGRNEEADFDTEDVTSPTLWKNSPTSIADTNWEIAQYKQEMLDKVRSTPGSNFELSMKDLVELSSGQKSPLNEKELSKTKDGSRKGQEKPMKSGRRLSRTESVNHGMFFLNLHFPIPGTWKRGGLRNRTASSKVSPKPIFTEGQKGDIDKSGESERWWRSNSISSGHRRR